MTTDYTKPPEQSPAADDIAPHIYINTKASDLKQLICTQCYETSIPIRTSYGSWFAYIPLLILMLMLIAIPSILWLLLLLLLHTAGNISGGWDAISSMNPFPLAGFIPQSPHSIKICRHCKAVNKMVPLNSRPGLDAQYWHDKQKRGGNITSISKQGKIS